jgi:chromate transporter
LSETNQSRPPSLAEIALVFLKLGATAFGGPAVHVAMMEEEFVRRREWISEADFMDRLAAANLIPGPSSTELAIFVGHLKRGWRGLIVAGCCFILPAALMVTAIAWAYVRYGSRPAAAGILYAIKPVVVAIVIQALGKLARTGLRTIFLVVIAGIAAVASLLGVSPVLVLLLAGAASAGAWWLRSRPTVSLAVVFPKMLSGAAVVVTGAVAMPVGLARLFFSFLKVGSVVFGSGYVLLAFLRSEFVERLHWLSERQLIDAVAVGQFTPGPLFTTATFIGYVVAGWSGAVVATVGIFVPGFLLVAIFGPLLPRLRRAPGVAAALDGVVAGSIALMAVVAWQLGKAAMVDRMTLALFVLSVGLLLRFRINAAALIVAAGVLGWGLQTIR